MVGELASDFVAKQGELGSLRAEQVKLRNAINASASGQVTGTISADPSIDPLLPVTAVIPDPARSRHLHTAQSRFPVGCAGRDFQPQRTAAAAAAEAGIEEFDGSSTCTVSN